MKKIGVLTLNGNYNFGNRLQTYAMQEVLKKYTSKVDNLWIAKKEKFKFHTEKRMSPEDTANKKFNIFCDFTNTYINNKQFDSLDDIDTNLYDYFIVGSDQIWNPTFPFFDYDKMFLTFSKDKNKNIAYAASIGIRDIPEEYIEHFKFGPDNFKFISVREENAKRILDELNKRDDIHVVVDPTMILPAETWDEIAKKPSGFADGEKYILTCFLGEFSKEHREEVNNIAKENNWKIINLMDEDDPYYCSGPQEFLYLEKHAELICTDSFHSCVFGIIYNRPFIVYDRVSDDVAPMNARIDTLINMFQLKNRLYINSINSDNLVCDYTEANVILEKEREKALSFIEKALDVK